MESQLLFPASLWLLYDIEAQKHDAYVSRNSIIYKK